MKMCYVLFHSGEDSEFFDDKRSLLSNLIAIIFRTIV